MTLSFYDLRCQGRTTRSMGAATLCGPCTDCRRRTDTIPGARYMQPPPFQTGWLPGSAYCPERIGPSLDVVDC